MQRTNHMCEFFECSLVITSPGWLSDKGVVFARMARLPFTPSTFPIFSTFYAYEHMYVLKKEQMTRQLHHSLAFVSRKTTFTFLSRVIVIQFINRVSTFLYNNFLSFTLKPFQKGTVLQFTCLRMGFFHFSYFSIGTADLQVKQASFPSC